MILDYVEFGKECYENMLRIIVWPSWGSHRLVLDMVNYRKHGFQKSNIPYTFNQGFFRIQMQVGHCQENVERDKKWRTYSRIFNCIAQETTNFTQLM